MKIIENVFIVPKVIANPYIIVDADGLTIIDAGLPGSAKKILAYISSLGKSAQDVKRILVTHSDFDHIGGLTALRKATGARVYASQIEADAMAVGKPSRPVQSTPAPSFRRLLMGVLRVFFKPTPVRVDEILKDGQTLPVLGGLRVIETIGHTPGHISFFAPSVGVLFCGDSIVSDNGLQGSRPSVTWDEVKAKEAVRRQSALGARIVCSGHGPVVMDAGGKFPGN